MQENVYFTNPGDCILNKVEIYDGSTLATDLKVKNCGLGKLMPFESKTNKIFFRVTSIRLSTKPTIDLVLTKFIASKCNV